MEQLVYPGAIKLFCQNVPAKFNKRTLELRVPVEIPDEYKNAGLWFVESASVTVFDAVGKREAGVFLVTDSGGTPRMRTPVSYPEGIVVEKVPRTKVCGFLGEVTFDEIGNEVEMTNALAINRAGPAVTKSIDTILTIFQKPNGYKKSLMCQSCMSTGMFIYAKDKYMTMPLHPIDVKCAAFVPMSKGPEEDFIRMFDGTVKIPAIESLAAKYLSTGNFYPGQYPVDFCKHVVTVWKSLRELANKIIKAGTNELVVHVAMNRDQGDDKTFSVKIELTLAHFYWDNPGDCLKVLNISDRSFTSNNLVPVPGLLAQNVFSLD